jgi:hypothetical protein
MFCTVGTKRKPLNSLKFRGFFCMTGMSYKRIRQVCIAGLGEFYGYSLDMRLYKKVRTFSVASQSIATFFIFMHYNYLK